MEGSVKDLSQYRFSCAKENLEAAKVLLQAGQFKSSVNRCYYAVFHGLRAVTALDHLISQFLNWLIPVIGYEKKLITRTFS